jgi:hypothetical protein
VAWNVYGSQFPSICGRRPSPRATLPQSAAALPVHCSVRPFCWSCCEIGKEKPKLRDLSRLTHTPTEKRDLVWATSPKPPLTFAAEVPLPRSCPMWCYPDNQENHPNRRWERSTARRNNENSACYFESRILRQRAVLHRTCGGTGTRTTRRCCFDSRCELRLRARVSPRTVNPRSCTSSQNLAVGHAGVAAPMAPSRLCCHRVDAL